MVDEVLLIKKIKKVAEALKSCKDPAARKKIIEILKQSFLSIQDKLSPRTKEVLTKSIERIIGEKLAPELEEPIPWDEVKDILADPHAEKDRLEKAKKQCVIEFGTVNGKQMYNMILVWLFYMGTVRSPQTLLDNVLNLFDRVIVKINYQTFNYEASDVIRPLNYMFFKFIALADKTSAKQVYDFYGDRGPTGGFLGDEHVADIAKTIQKDTIDEKDIDDIKRIFDKGLDYLQKRLVFSGLPDDPSVAEAAINRMKGFIKYEIQKRISSLAPKANEPEVKKQIYMLGKIADKLGIELDGRQKLIVATARKGFHSPTTGRIKYAIMSDVHANLQALNAVYANILSQNVDRIVFLGDSVGYGGNPNECANKIAGEIKPFVTILGNHDDAAVTGKPYGFNPMAATAIRWTHETLTASTKSYLSNLPTQAEEGNLIFTHGCPGNRNMNLWTYIGLESNFEFPTTATNKMQPKQIAFMGHTHYPMAFIQTVTGNNIELKSEDIRGPVEFTHEEFDKAAINVGSVGQPRDGNPNACYVLFTIEDNKYTIEFKRVPYKIKAAQKAITTYWKAYCTKENLTHLINNYALATRLAKGT